LTIHHIKVSDETLRRWFQQEQIPYRSRKKRPPPAVAQTKGPSGRDGPEGRIPSRLVRRARSRVCVDGLHR
jgi:hypothetical protein